MNTAVIRPHAVPEASGNARAVALAVVVHALLGALLFFGIRWQSSPPAVIQAELWSATPQTAAPPPRIPPPQVEPPTPEPRVAPKLDVEPPVPKADILEKAPPKVEPKKPDPVKVAAPKPVAPLPLPKVESKPKPELKPELKSEPAKLPPPKDVPARPPSDLASIMASANGTPTSTGKDQQTSGPRGRDSYVGRLVTAIRSQMRYPASSPGNPFAMVHIEQLPNGEVVNVTVTRPSGVPAFDEAVERAIRAASPLPRDEQGKVERQLDLHYDMYEKN